MAGEKKKRTLEEKLAAAKARVKKTAEGKIVPHWSASKAKKAVKRLQRRAKTAKTLAASRTAKAKGKGGDKPAESAPAS